jgi:hypothetical protein
MTWLNRHSYPFLSVVIVAGIVGAGVWKNRIDLGAIVALLVGAVLVIFFVAMRRGKITPANPEKRIRRNRGSARALVVHVYGDYHLGSLLKHIMTGRTEHRFRGRCEFIFVDVDHHEAQRAINAVGAKLGDYILYDAQGNLVERTRLITARKLTKLLELPSH